MRVKMCVAATILAHAMVCAASVPQAEDLWHEQVEPLLDRSCFKCHGGVRQKSGLDLRSLENMLKGGDRGPAIIPGQPEESHLYQFVQPDAETHMPPRERREARESDPAKDSKRVENEAARAAALSETKPGSGTGSKDKHQLTSQEMGLLRAWIGALPGTNGIAVSTTNQALWVPAYMKTYRQLNTPAWVPPEGMAMHDVIDRFLRIGWRARQVEPSPLCDDRTFARRVYLDLAGRIPTAEELEQVASREVAVASNGAAEQLAVKVDWAKRESLVETLLDGPDYPRRMREVFDVVLLDRKGPKAEEQRWEHGWFAFLEHAFAENYPWDKIVRELILARPEDPQDAGAVWYLSERQNNYQAMAEAIAPIAFGVQIGCAQCHNHPLAAEVEQRHYWGLVAAFNRSKNVECTSSSGVAESAIGGFISFANLKRESQPAQMAFLNGWVVPETRPADGEKELDAPELYIVPPPKEKEKPAQPAIPKFSRRAALAQAATHNNPQLARAFVNRVWALLFGRGLVHPVDQLDSRHRASHPDLLNWLAQEFEESGYDVKALLREIVLSQAYQLDSRPMGDRLPPVTSFARGPEKPLSAEQLFRSFRVAAGLEPESASSTVQSAGAGRDSAAATGSDDAESELRRAFIAQFPELFPSEYNASLQQATFLSNSPLVDKLLASDSKTMVRLLAQPDVEARVDLAFTTVLGRKPDRAERATCREFLAQRNPEKGARELLWALLTSGEFQMNH